MSSRLSRAINENPSQHSTRKQMGQRGKENDGPVRDSLKIFFSCASAKRRNTEKLKVPEVSTERMFRDHPLKHTMAFP